MVRHEGLHLLPPGSTAVEIAESLTSAKAREGIPYAEMPTVFDPWACPLRLLPWLATVFSVDVWDDTWSETRKRRMIANAIRLQRLKGTRAGVEEVLPYVDAEAVQFTTPPEYFYLGRAPTEDERNAWVAALPQIRLGYIKEDGTSVGFFLGADYVSEDATTPDDAGDRLAKHATYFVQGREVQATVERDLNEVWRVYLPRQGDTSLYLAADFLGDAPTVDLAADQVLTILPQRVEGLAFNLVDRLPTGPSLTPVTRVPETVPIPHDLPGAAFARCFDGEDVFLVPDDAWMWIYDRVAIVDPSVPAPSTDLGGGFLTADRLGIPAHTAEIRVKVEHHDPAFALGVDVCNDFLTPNTAPQRVEPAYRAVEAMRRRSDVILIDTQTKRSPEIGDTLIVGTPIRIGESRGL